jgi:hypothetical protein
VEWLGGVWFGKARLSNSSLKQGVLEMNYLVRCGSARLGTAWFGKARSGLAWFFNSSLQKDALKKLDQGEAWHGAVGCGKARHGLVW